MSINSLINEGNDRVLERDPGLGARVYVEGHVLVTLDVHEVEVEAEQGRGDRLLLNISYK